MGLHYNGYRDYDSATGRYQQADPIGFNGGQWSLYAYVGGNPLIYGDRLGLSGGADEGDPAEEEAFRDLMNPKLGPNSADPATRNVIREELVECRAPWNKKPPILIDPADVAGLTPAQIDALARKLG